MVSSGGGILAGTTDDRAEEQEGPMFSLTTGKYRYVKRYGVGEWQPSLELHFIYLLYPSNRRSGYVSG